MTKTDHFLTWLQTDNFLGSKSARDVLSRLKRVAKYVDLPSAESVDQATSNLNGNPEFQKLSINVKSQLRRSLKFFFLFKESRFKGSQSSLF